MIRLTPPTPRGFISSGWGRPREYRNGVHEGLDFPAPKGSPVLAAAAGEVVYVKNVSNSYAGKWIGIHHGGGMFTRYLHNDRNHVSKGDKVHRGQQIALLGQTGTSGTGAPHVHFDVKFQPDAHADYVSRYGTPSGGWGKSSTYGKGVPGETFMSGASYSDLAKNWAEDRGVVFYSGVGALGVLALAGSVYIGFRLVK